MTLHVERVGSGPDLVLLHGWGLHSGVWEELLPGLAQRFTVHAMDLPGHGHSAQVRPGTLDQAVDAVAAALPDGAIVCGWSLGGLAAQRLALRHPARVRALALASTTPCFVARDDWPAAMLPATLAEFAAGLGTDRQATLERFVALNALNGSRGREALRAFARKLDARGAPSAASLQATLGWLRDTDLRDAAPAIAAPTVVIHGARDALAPVAAGRWLARALPRAQLCELEDAAHLPFFTHRERFVAALESLHA